MMKFHILTLFPDMVTRTLSESIIGRAAANGCLSINAVDIRAYTEEKHGKVDDYPYGGGAGMLMQAQPVYDAWKAVTGGRRVRTVFLTPQGETFSQKKAKELAKEEELILLCGHYEGIDERVLEEIVTDEISIGDYVLTGGELGAMVVVDAVSRLLPGVLHNEESAETESFSGDLLEYPQYSRPEVWHDCRVPEVLLTGDHKRITAWRVEQACERTKLRRPDLYAKYEQKQRIIKRLSKEKRRFIHMMEGLRRGLAEVLYENGRNLLLWEAGPRNFLIHAESAEELNKLLAILEEHEAQEGQALNFVVLTNQWEDILRERLGLANEICRCYQATYTIGEPAPVRHKDIRPLTKEQLSYVSEHYHMAGEEYVRDRIERGALYGVYEGEALVGFGGYHDDESIGLLYIDEAYRGRGYARSMEGYLINRLRAQGKIPYGHIVYGNEASLKLQESMGLILSQPEVYWLWRA